MIRHFAVPRYTNRWTPLLAVEQSTRHLKVLFEVDCLSGDPQEGRDAAALLWRLLHLDDFERWYFSESGPPESVERVPLGEADVVSAPDWVITRRLPNEAVSGCAYDIVWRHGATITRSFIFSSELPLALAQMAPGPNPLPSEHGEPAGLKGDGISVLVAKAVGAELLITDSPSLALSKLAADSGITVATPADALPLVSLYLRSRGRFLGDRWSGPSSATVVHELHRPGFYEVGAWDLLPEASRWYGACLAHKPEEDGDGLVYLAAAVLRRVAKTLQSRDDLLRAVNQGRYWADADDAVEALEACLTLLVGALDATARVVHFVLGLRGSSFAAAWKPGEWLERVKREAPHLAEVVAEDTRARAVLEVAARLRNTVHSTSLPARFERRSGRPGSIFAQVPREVAANVRAQLQCLGGLEHWGMTERPDGWLDADPSVLLDRLLPELMLVLNRVMAATPVEDRLGYVHEPSQRESQVPFDAATRLSVRRQLGIIPDGDWPTGFLT